MAIIKLYSQRQLELATSGQADVYQYDEVPKRLRVQIKQIAIEAGGAVTLFNGYHEEDNEWWLKVEEIFCREKGVDQLAKGKWAADRLFSFMETCSVEDWLDLLELIATVINLVGEDSRRQYRQTFAIKGSAEDAIKEINYRLRQAAFGYQIEAGKLMRVDVQFIHSEVVKPALELLSGVVFDGARQEFLTAHRHYRSGEGRQAVAMAANALESTFKAVFAEKDWSYPKGARISDLVKVAKANKLWPDFLDGSFDQLVATLQSGLPKIRDNHASHGQGVKPIEVPDYVAAYALHLAASKIVFIVKAAEYGKPIL